MTLKFNSLPNNLVNDGDRSPTESSLIHTYPGSMPGYLASRLAERYSNNGDLVFDPFCGSGAVLVEASKLGRAACGTDLLSIAVSISSAALNLPDPEEILSIWEDIYRSALQSSSLFSDRNGVLNTEKLSPSHALLADWLEVSTLEKVLTIYSEIGNIDDDVVCRLFKLMLASSLMSLSKRVKKGVLHWGWIADNVKPKPDSLLAVDPFHELDGRVRRLVRFMRANATRNLMKGPQSSVVQHNWLTTPASEPEFGVVDLLLTSPPYPYSIDYTLAVRLSHYLLEIPFAEIKSHEIGARYKRKRRDREKEYLADLGAALARSTQLVKPGGVAAFVMPHPEEYRTVIEFSTEEWIDFLHSSFSGNWQLRELGIRDCTQRRLVHQSKATRRELILAFERNPT